MSFESRDSRASFFDIIKSITRKLVHNHNGKPSYLSELISSYQLTRSLRSSGTHLLKVPDIQTEIGRRSFSYAAPAIWNSLPQDLWSCTSITTFQRKLKFISSHRRSVVTDFLPWITDLHCFGPHISLSVCAFAGAFWWFDAVCSCICCLKRPWHHLRVRNRTLNPHWLIDYMYKLLFMKS